MQEIAIADAYLRTRYSFFKWRYSLSPVKKVALALGMACVTGLLAQVCIPLSFTPVPITAQVLGVLLSGVVCGGMFGSISQIIYVGLGMAGIPWFAGGTSGTTFICPTGGYFIGFILAPLVIGSYTDRQISHRTFLSQIKFMLIGVGIIYAFGAIFLAFAIRAGFWETMVKGVIPFILVDLVKASIAAGFSSSILPKASYNGEIDGLRYKNKRY